MNYNKIIYLLSDLFEYNRRMCTGDCGKEYAESLDLKSIKLSEIKNQCTYDVIMCDSRFLSIEFEELEKIVVKYNKVMFLMAITDPYYEHEQYSPYVVFLKKMHEHVNVFIVSKYQPEEVISDLKKKYKNKFLILNYVYEKERELLIDFEKKKNKILLSGSTSRTLYPERWFLYKVSKRFPFNLMIEILEHPGYPDVGHVQTHNITEDKYVEYISNYKFVLVTDSRCKLEFMKYREAGYAGTLVIGFSPKTFSENLKKSMILINIIFPFITLFKIFFISKNKYLKKINDYRTNFYNERGKKIQIKKLIDFINLNT